MNVIVWNVETYGRTLGARGDYRGINTFIAKYMIIRKASVLVMEEFKPEGSDYIDDLVAILNRESEYSDWVVDYVEGAIQSIRTGQVTLEWGSNNEGYAVVFRRPALIPIPNGLSVGVYDEHRWQRYHYITLVEQGAPPNINPQQPNVIAHPVDVVQNEGEMIRLGFPTSSTGVISPQPQRVSERRNINYEQRYGEQVAAAMQETFARRPARIELNINGGIPGIIYHAPVASPACMYAAMVSGLTQRVVLKSNGQNYDYPNLFLGGDFNIIGANNRILGFNNVMHYGLQPLALANAPGPGPALDVPSTVHFDAQQGFLNHARDQIFWRGGWQCNWWC